MSTCPTLHVAPCTHEAAAFAVMRWHYSHRMPMPPMVRYGVWEGQEYRGCILFGRGANPSLGKPYSLLQTECCELLRVALRAHEAPVSKIVAVALRLLRRDNPGLRLVISFADPREGHHGGIYQAMNWVFAGETSTGVEYLLDGRWQHSREITSGAFGGQRKVQNYKTLPSRKTLPKYRYLYPLDDAMRAQIASLAKPYPKRAGSIVADAPPHPGGEGGSVPTSALHLSADSAPAQEGA